MLDLAIDPYVVHPVQFILDYPLAFSALGLAGLFEPTVRGAILGATVAVMARFSCHFLSGVFFFASIAPEGWNPYLYRRLHAAYLARAWASPSWSRWALKGSKVRGLRQDSCTTGARKPHSVRARSSDGSPTHRPSQRVAGRADLVVAADGGAGTRWKLGWS